MTFEETGRGQEQEFAPTEPPVASQPKQRPEQPDPPVREQQSRQETVRDTSPAPRGEEPAGHEQHSTRSFLRINTHPLERFVSASLGGALVVLGLSRRSIGGGALALAGGGLLYRGISGHSYLYQMLDINNSGTRDQTLRPEERTTTGATEITGAITIDRPADELYRRWREPETFTQVMGHFAEVTGDEQQMHWEVQGPLGRGTEWDTRIIEDRPGELLRWEALPGARVPHEGRVRFRPAPRDRGTEVILNIKFNPPGGALGSKLLQSLGKVSNALASKALRRFKSLIETGEIPTTEHQPAARGASRDD